MLLFALFSLLVWPPRTGAQTPADDLARGIELFEAAQYGQAQLVLLALDREALSDEQKELRDKYVDEVRLAISLSRKAGQDHDQAGLALERGELDRAEMLYRAVIRNDYAGAELRQAAETGLARIEEKRQLAAALDQEQPLAAGPAEAPVESSGEAEPEADPSAEARALVARGRAALDMGDYTKARDSFEAALALRPGMPEALEGLNEARNQQTVATQGESLVDRIRWQKDLLWSRTEAAYRQLEDEARQAVADEDFDTANLKVLRARQVIESGRANADPLSKYETLREQVDELERYVSRQEEIWHERDLKRKRDEVARQESMRRSRIEESRRIRIEGLMNQARQFQRERKLEQAIDALKQIEAIDPTYERAKWMREDLENTLFLWNQRDFRDELYSSQSEAIFDVEQSQIPSFQTIRYPKNWPEITARRMPYNLGRFGSANPSAAARARLSAVVPKVSMDGTAFADALKQLRDIGDFNMHVNWRALESSGITRDTPVTTDLTDVKLAKALSLVLDGASPADSPLGYEIDDGVVTVSTREDLDRKTVTRVYDIRDLVVHIPNFDDAPSIMLNPPSGLHTPQPEKMSESLFNESEEEALASADAGGSVVDKILDTIRDTVCPGTWRSQGGLVGSIRELNGQIIVTHTLQAQQQLTSLLDQLRETRSIQVSVEARFLTVRTNFLEDIGMDLDIILNNGNAGFDQAMVPDANGIPQVAVDPNTGGTLLIPRQFSRLGFMPAVPGGLGQQFTQTVPNQPYQNVALVPGTGIVAPHSSSITPVPMLNNVLGFADPRNIQTGIPGSFGGASFQQPALQVFGSFLDNIQVDFLLRATQADGRSTFLEAPRLTLSNGQRAYVAMVTQQAYISGLNAIVAEEVGQVEPIISTLNTGSVLDVEATVGADRRYVTMTIRTGLAVLERLEPVQVQTTGTSSRGVGAVVQLPRIRVSTARATITVPEGGTVLFGGLKQTGEVELEGGVPILSKIPILKRAYSSRSTARDENMLLILVKPRIIIQEEAEEDAFPAFTMR
jgi:type II secretory pathway component GspD/PulD (secretin)/tetratricopeptide (TPR) repeat protein